MLKKSLEAAENYEEVNLKESKEFIFYHMVKTNRDPHATFLEIPQSHENVFEFRANRPP